MDKHQPARAPREPRADERRLQIQIAGLGITTEEKTVYRYEGYTYERLEDALAYARIEEAARSDTLTAPGRAQP